MNAEAAAPILLLCFGNPAREDDGLGPKLAERLEGLALPGVRVESDYQLCVEDSVAIAESALVVFVDASLSGGEPFAFDPVVPRRDGEFMSHSIAPDALLALAQETLGSCPDAYLLAIRGYSFEMFKEGLTQEASSNLEEAIEHLLSFLRSKGVGRGLRLASQPAVQDPEAPAKVLGG